MRFLNRMNVVAVAFAVLLASCGQKLGYDVSVENLHDQHPRFERDEAGLRGVLRSHSEKFWVGSYLTNAEILLSSSDACSSALYNFVSSEIVVIFITDDYKENEIDSIVMIYSPKSNDFTRNYVENPRSSPEVICAAE
ncbi:hypothetical protein FKB34_04900 [Glycocaulis profundi]|nr:hypothetical protein FKB34_04900 [Glycocaulis profundi]